MVFHCKVGHDKNKLWIWRKNGMRERERAKKESFSRITIRMEFKCILKIGKKAIVPSLFLAQICSNGNYAFNVFQLTKYVLQNKIPVKLCVSCRI